MQLISYRVTNFRSVEDSGPISVDRVTAFIGVNESGKTNLLLPLWKLNPAQEGEIQPTSDYPKKLFGTIREEPEAYKFIAADFSVETAFAIKLATLSGQAAVKLDRVVVSRYFDGAYEVEFPNCPVPRIIDTKVVSDALSATLAEIEKSTPLLKEEQIAATLKDALAKQIAALTAPKLGSTNTVAIHKYLSSVLPAEPAKTSVIVPLYAQLLDKIAGFTASLSKTAPGDIDEVRDAVIEALPKFVYYSNYGNLDSEIYLPHVVQNLKRTDLGAKESAKARTLRVLFQFVRLSPEEILELGKDFDERSGREPTAAEIEVIAEKKRERSILLQSAGTLLTEKFREWWKQGDYRFRFEADGDHFRIWVADDRRPEEIELESRSTGLQWFLSFYLVFLVESGQTHKNSILLLDEPGLSLHPLAQRDLSAFFDNLAKTNQIAYTTHSPFLVDADRLDRARKVFVAADGTTKATENLREEAGDGQRSGAAYAVHSALNLTVAESLLLGCTPIIVEGPSDQHYLAAIKTLLIANGKIKPSRELVFPPSGGAKTAKMVASILTGRDEALPLVLLDDDIPGRKAAGEMCSSLYQGDPDRLINVASFVPYEGAEVEDLFPASLIADAIDRQFRVSEPEDEFAVIAKDDAPIVPQIEAWAATHSITLALGWKVDLAKRVKQQLLARGLASVPDEAAASWVKLFEAFAA